MTTPRRQCAKCPWKKSTDLHKIPNGYSADLHRGLAVTIAEPGCVRGLAEPTLMMACHETSIDDEQPCVGWLMHQLGPGNNLGLRLKAMFGQVDTNVELVGPQHATFEETLPS